MRSHVDHPILKQNKENKIKILNLLSSMELETTNILFGGIAQDFNDFLFGIRINADLGLLAIPEDSPAKSNFINIIEILKDAIVLCKQMMAYSGKERPGISLLDITDLIKNISKLLEISISGNIRLEYDLSENIPFIEADAAQISSLLINILLYISDLIGQRTSLICIKTGIKECNHEYLINDYSKENFEEGNYVLIEIFETAYKIEEEAKKKMFEHSFDSKFSDRKFRLPAIMEMIFSHKGICKVSRSGIRFEILFPVFNIL